MYNIDRLPVINTQPWIKPFSERVAQLLAAKESGLSTVVFLYEAPDTSTFRYRVYNICQAMELGLYWRGSWFYADELCNAEKYLDSVDVIVISRFRWSFELEQLIFKAKRKGIKISFDIDDMVYNVKYVPTIVNTLSVDMSLQGSYDYWFSYVSRLQLAVSLADTLITTNGFLAKKMQNDIGKETYIISNFYNRLQSEYSEKFFLQKNEQSTNGKFVIGYFSGTPSHINDFMVVESEIKQLLEKYDDIVLKIVGFMSLPPSYSELLSAGKVIQEPLVDFIELQRKIAEVDVNIVPLVNNEFSNCKSELKYYEASIVGVVTCATPSYVFKNVINDGVNGYICERGKWFSTLEMLYLTRKQGTTEVVRNARECCIENYAYFNQTLGIEKVFNDIYSKSRKQGEL